MKTVVVTGASGFLGRYIIQALIRDTDHQVIGIYNNTKPTEEHSHRVSYTQCNLYDVMSLELIIASAQYVVHAAAIVSFHPIMEVEMKRFNRESTANIVNLCLENNIQKLIHISSISALGGIENQTMNEAFDNKSGVSHSAYGLSKKESELEVWRGVQEGLNATILNPSLIIGSGDWTKGSPNMIRSVAKGLKYYPTGSTGFVYAGDVAKLVTLTLDDNNSNGQRYLCSASSLPYLTVIQEVAKCLGKDAPVKPIQQWHINLVGIAMKIKSVFSRSNTAIITKASLVTPSKHYAYDGSKCTTIPGFTYTNISSAVDKICQEYMV